MTFLGLTPADDRKEKLCFKCEDVKYMCGHLLATEKKGDVQRSPYFREVGEVRGSERINGGWIFLSPHICIRNPKVFKLLDRLLSSHRINYHTL